VIDFPAGNWIDSTLQVACDPLPNWEQRGETTVNFFHRHDDQSSEERPPLPDPSPLPELKPHESPTPISLSPLQEAQLKHALIKKEKRPLKDLPVDDARARVIGGGLGKGSAANKRSPSENGSDNPII
jgi:hypothetical protein